MAVEQSLVIVKPDAVVKHITGDIISKISETSLTMVAAKVMKVTRDLAIEHYQHLKEKDFFDELIRYIMGEFHTESVLALVYEGEDACKKIREVVGATNPEQANPTSVRGKYGRITSKGVMENVVHASESASEGKREIQLWFTPDELMHTIYPVTKKDVSKEELCWKEE